MLRRIFTALVPLAIVVLIVSGCGGVVQSGSQGGGGGGFQLASYIRDHVEQDKKLVIMVSYHDTSLGFAVPIRQGVEKAAKELGVDAELIGPANGSAQEQVNELQSLIVQHKVDGLAVSSASNNALKPVIAQAYDEGIPIISFNTNNPGSKQMAFVGQNLTQSGQVEAEQLQKELGGKQGKVVVFSVDTGAGWSHDRFSGFQSGMEGANGIQIQGPVNTGNEPSQAYNQVQNTMTANSDAIAIASLDCCSLDAAAKWAQQNNKAGEMTVVGFDVLPQTATFVRQGVVQFTLSQNPTEQGYQSVKLLHDYLTKNAKMHDINTGVKLVDKSNIDSVPVEG